jgi:hypothetical protein
VPYVIRSLTLREEHRLKLSENKVPRRIFGAKREEVVGGCRRLHNGELHNLYTSPNVIRMITTTIRCSMREKDGKCVQRIVRKPEGKRPCGSPICRWEHNI